MKKRLSKKTLISVCTLIAALIIWTIWSNTALTLSTVTVSSNRIPAAFNGFRIAQISDLHNAVFGEDNAELLQILSECEPNIIVITGDLVDAEHTDIDVALDFAKEAVQIADTYYVTGNHEASLSQYDELKAELENTGVVVLEDKAMQLEYNGDDITLARQVGESVAQIKRYIRLTNLIPKILAMVDEGKIAFTIGVELSYLSEEEQYELHAVMDLEQCTPSLSQANRMKRMSQRGELDMDDIYSALEEEKPNQREQIKIRADTLDDYFPDGFTPKQKVELIERLVKEWHEKQIKD